MADEPKKLSDLISQVLGHPDLPNAFPEIGTPSAGTAPSAAMSDLIKILLESDKRKKAAETGVVDNAVANAWFNDHWKQPRQCPVCSQSTWGVAPTFAHIPLTQVGKGLVGTYQPVQTFPCVVVTCRTCGNTLFFNAIVMGLLPSGTE